MRNDIVGYICLCRWKDAKDVDSWYPLAYGYEKDQRGRAGLQPSWLLRDRGATLFPSQETAREALRKTLTEAEEGGSTWPSKMRYRFEEVRAP